MTSRPPDRKNGNTARAGSSRIWKRIEEAFQAWTGKSETGTRTPIGPQLVGDAMLLQARGCIVRHAAESGILIEHDDEVMTYLLDRLAPLLTGQEGTQMIAEKRMQLIAKGLVIPEIPGQVPGARSGP